jgi:hypothetical protein
MKIRSPFNWSWGLAALLLANLAHTACGQGELVLSPKWSVDAVSRPYLGTTSNWPRGAWINRVTGHVLVPTTAPSNQVAVLSGADGSDLGNLNVSGLTGGHTASFNIMMGGVADDGVIYMGNLEVNSTVFRIWRWSSEDTNVVPVSVFGPADPGPVQTRIGDSFAVRGAGANTQIIASGTGSGYFTVFTTIDGTNFTAHQFALPTGLAAGEACRGVPFDGANNAFYAINSFSSTAHHIGFDLTAGTSSLIDDITLSVPASCISFANLSGFRIMPAINDDSSDSSAHRLVVYDISDPAAALVADGGLQPFPGTRVKDGNGTGSTDVGAGMIVGFNTHNGLIALSVSVVTNPPSIVIQPQDHTTFAGGKATFSVTAAGSRPLHYQWYLNGTTPLLDATNSTLTIDNVQTDKVGDYSVVVTNVANQVTSAKAKLMLATPVGYPAAIAADNPLAYWRLDEASGALARDVWGGHDGAYVNATLGLPGYSLIDADTSIGLNSATPGGVSVADNSAFNFTGSAPAFTLEGWVNFTDFQGVQRLFSDVDYSVVGAGSGIGFGVVDANTLRFTTYGVQDFDLDLGGYGPLSPGQWYYLAGVADGAGNFIFYLNGQPVGVISFTGDAVGSTKPFCLGRSPNGIEAVNGQIDELAVYGTALTADQVLAHYNTRYGASTPPLIRRQPVAVTNYVSLNATFTVLAEGSGTLSYQWQQNNVDLPGQASQTLTLGPLDSSSAGDYSVVITGVGSTNSAKAHLTVLPVPTTVDLSAGLVLHLKFDGDFLDYSGRGNHGTNVGATTFVTDGKTGSQAAHFISDPASANYNYVTLGLRPDLEFSSNVNFSVAYWVRQPAGQQPGDVPFLGNAVGAGNSPGYFFGPAYKTGGWRWTLENADASYDLPCPGAANSINDGNWHHVASTFNRTGNGITYLDGLEVSSVSIASVGDLDTHQPTVVGQDPTGTYAETATFDLNDLGVWRRVLTPLEAASMYLAGASNSVNFVSAPVRLQAQLVAAQVQLVWSGGLLQAADQVSGPYTDVANANSPYSVAPAGTKKFYRLRQ